ncbi:MAG: carboxy-S-adenosyl-L-methionine synthase CmoA [Desulfobulbaceae bacterium]|nr:MAG: carboxy-S-adenosyl-L-methionine synthase CmoA [Desulfobulbaceae bacterium]
MEKKKQDRLYQVDTVPEDFDFSERVVEVFDDMLDRSIPHYHEVIKGIATLMDIHLEAGDRVCDLGCATGTPLLEFSRLLQHKDLQFLGIDNSLPMLEKARLKTELFSHTENISYRQADITSLELPGTGAFILNYTLQFIRPLVRPLLLKRLFDNLRPGGLLFLSEKTVEEQKMLNRSFIEVYHRFKREKGYSDLEIAKKREALENILIPFSAEENQKLLTDAGFDGLSVFFQWFNFCSIVAVKPR